MIKEKGKKKDMDIKEQVNNNDKKRLLDTGQILSTSLSFDTHWARA